MRNDLAPETISPGSRFGTFVVRMKWADDLPDKDLEVLSFEGEEELSRPFQFKVRVRHRSVGAGADPGDEEVHPAVERVLGRRASLSWWIEGTELPKRWVFAQVEAAYSVESVQALPYLELILGPPLLNAMKNRRSRVFNYMNVEEIAVTRTLRDEFAGLGGGACDVKSFLYGAESRRLTLQFEESDFDFASRLLDSIGASYHFEHDERSMVMVVRGDHAGRERDTALSAWGAGSGMQRFPGFEEFRMGRAAEPRGFAARGLDEDQTFVASTWSPQGDRALSCIPVRAVHRRRPRADIEAEARREGRRASTASGIGVTTYPCVRTGTILDFPSTSRDRSLLVVKVTHVCNEEHLYRAEVVTSPDIGTGASDLSFTPRRAAPPPRIHGLIRGIVTNNRARDSRWGMILEVRLAGFSEPMEMPLAAGVANAGTSVVAVPSEGDEVLVAFEDGDPDFPYVIGSVQTVQKARELSSMRPFSDGTQLALVAGQTAVALQDQDGASHLHLQAGNSFQLRTETFVQKIEPSRTSVEVSSQATLSIAGTLQVEASAIHISASRVTIDAGMVQCFGLLKCDTIVASAVIGSSYTPGAGNIW